jgi:hypothetical protein
MRLLTLPLLFILATTPVTAAQAVSPPNEYGDFVPPEPAMKVLQRECYQQLLEDFYYKDKSGRRWFVPADFKSDGASIPSAFKSMVGGCWDGAYKFAAIVHDYYCDRQTADWQDVHKMFYEGMLAAGVGPRKAWVMYQAVYQFGPRWRSLAQKEQDCMGKEFDARKCTLNDLPRSKIQHPKLDRRALNGFIDDLRKSGYGDEADEVQQKVHVK